MTKFLVLFTTNGDNEPDMAHVVDAENDDDLKSKIFNILNVDPNDKLELDMIREQEDAGNDILVAELVNDNEHQTLHTFSFEIFSLLED